MHLRIIAGRCLRPCWSAHSRAPPALGCRRTRMMWTSRTSFTLNGRSVQAEVEPRLSLADCLRHKLKMTGTHVGCEHGVCGACTVIVDGAAVRSCLMLAVQADGADVDHGRGAYAGRRRPRSEPAAGELPQAPCAAMRLLHAGNSHHRPRAADRRARCQRGPHS